jgi:hypothetical protein
VAVSKTALAVIVFDLDEKGLEFLEGAVGQTVGLHERETQPA